MQYAPTPVPVPVTMGRLLPGVKAPKSPKSAAPSPAHNGFGQIEDHHAFSLAGFVREVHGQEVELKGQGLGHLVDGLGKLIADPVPEKFNDAVGGHSNK